MMRSNSNLVTGVTSCLLVSDLEVVIFYSIKLKFVLHLNDGRLPGHTDTSPDGVSITCDSIITKHNYYTLTLSSGSPDLFNANIERGLGTRLPLPHPRNCFIASCINIRICLFNHSPFQLQKFRVMLTSSYA